MANKLMEITKHEEWIKKNPLRVFRKRNKLSLGKAAGLIGVQINTIQSWEFGAATPNRENLQRLEKLIPGAREMWEAWFNLKSV